MMIRKVLGPFGLVSATGVLLGALCFVAALTPSLVPRSGLLQGVVAGLSFAAGYGIGVVASFLWRSLQMPIVSTKTLYRIYTFALILGALAVLTGLALAPSWQNEVRSVMGLGPVETVRPFTVAGVAALVAGFLLALGRLFWLAVRLVSRWALRFMPERVALGVGLICAALLFSFVGNDLFLTQAFRTFDRIYAGVDATMATQDGRPQSPFKSGGEASLLRWEELGGEGRAFVSSGPTANEITAITARPALEPLRVYVGVGAAQTAQERADLALEEALRIGAFERGTLVLATPTGTGWMDPSAHFPLEVLLDGDVATIGVQYSYLPSWLSLLAVPEYGAESARAVFLAFHRYWSALPEATRPKLYLFGLSLGAMNTDRSSDFYDVINAPYDGAFMVGPPFTSRSWAQVTHDRDAGTPAWLPTFRKGEVVRFMAQGGMPEQTVPWARTRWLYLQYASDAIVFFSPSILWKAPEWLKGQRGPDVSENLRWVPVVTFLQVGFDLITATSTPRGYGHVYAGVDYMAGWSAILNRILSPDEEAALRAALLVRGL